MFYIINKFIMKKSLNSIVLVAFFKKHSFVITAYSLAACVLLEYLSQSKWLILAFAVLSFIAAITQVSIGLKKKK
jgi:hypothetical protein